MSTVEADPKSIELDTLLANILNSSAIEGEQLNAFSVRSSLANKLGVSESQPSPTSPRSDGMAAMMIDAIHDLDSPLTLERIYQWHQWLFTESESATNEIRIGALRIIGSG